MSSLLIFELIRWYFFILQCIPERVGIILRNFLIPCHNGKNIKICDIVHIDYSKGLIIGDNSSINRGCLFNESGGIEIGDNVLLGPKIIIYSRNHNFRKWGIPKNQQGDSFKKVSIGNNVWIGANSIILPEVTIGDNCVIGVGSIITKNVASGLIVTSVPSQKVRV